MQSTTLAARPSKRAARRPFGFTLIELMIVVAVIAILAMIALPLYAEQVRKGKRSEAMQALGDLQLRQESWRADHPTYGNTDGADAAANNLFGSTAAVGTYNTGLKNYTVSSLTANSSGTGYLITATRKGDLANDPKCANFTLTMTAGVLTKGTSDNKNVDYCWRK